MQSTTQGHLGAFVDMEMTEQIDWRAKQPSRVAYVSEALYKC